MLASTLNAGDVKNSAGTGTVYSRVSSNTNGTEFASSAETPSRPDRFKVSHQTTGSGFTRKRRSVIRFDYTHASDVDATKNVVTSFYVVGDIPVGAVVSTTPIKDALAKLLSLVAGTAAGTTILYDGTGNGAICLLRGES